MTSEEEQNLQAHIEAIAAILYQDTEKENLKTLEGIEQAVRQQMLKHISPKIGVFLSKKQQEQQQVAYGSLIFRVGRQIVGQGEYRSRLGSSLTAKSFAARDLEQSDLHRFLLYPQ